MTGTVLSLLFLAHSIENFALSKYTTSPTMKGLGAIFHDLMGY